MQVIDLRDRTLCAAELRDLMPRAALTATGAQQQVLPLLEAVRTQGVAALYQQAAEFDGVTGHELRVSAAATAQAVAAADPELVAALQQMIVRVRAASAAQIPPPQQTVLADGAVVQQRWQPVQRVGLYVPGGKAVYPSSVVMNAVAALTAGVRELALVSPVQAHGGVDPTVLLAAHLCGVSEVYAIGGAGAIAALAYGVPELDLAPVDVITGPGNIFVAAAKRAVSGLVGIDSEAGTTEIMVLADATADPLFVAADLVSQAEHDEAAAAVLVTDCPELAAQVQQHTSALAAATTHSARVTAALHGPQSGIILVADTAQMVAVADAYAAEHLSVQTSDAAALAAQVHNAGAIFVGSYAPVSLGDYMAGSNHVLPTGGTARFAAGLGAHTFLRPQQTIVYTQQALAEVAPALQTIALAEGLPAHNAAVQTRLSNHRNQDPLP